MILPHRFLNLLWTCRSSWTGRGAHGSDLLLRRVAGTKITTSSIGISTGTDVSSSMSGVSSQITFLMSACLPDRNLCTPESATIEHRGAGYHVILPGNLEWGAGIPNPSGRTVTVTNAHGIVCWDAQSPGSSGGSGPSGVVHPPVRVPCRWRATSSRQQGTARSGRTNRELCAGALLAGAAELVRKLQAPMTFTKVNFCKSGRIGNESRQLFFSDIQSRGREENTK